MLWLMNILFTHDQVLVNGELHTHGNPLHFNISQLNGIILQSHYFKWISLCLSNMPSALHDRKYDSNWTIVKQSHMSNNLQTRWWAWYYIQVNTVVKKPMLTWVYYLRAVLDCMMEVPEGKMSSCTVTVEGWWGWVNPQAFSAGIDTSLVVTTAE